MDMEDLTALADRQPGVNVFNSDDDLTSFLAGLRAKYASLYPQYPEAEGDSRAHGDTDGQTELPAAAGPAPGPGFGGDTLSGTSTSFEQKLSQLRSSLQSLQHLLPARNTTSANLLDSFMAVSGDRASVGPAAGAPLSGSAALSMAPAEAEQQAVAAAALHTAAVAAGMGVPAGHADAAAEEPCSQTGDEAAVNSYGDMSGRRDVVEAGLADAVAAPNSCSGTLTLERVEEQPAVSPATDAQPACDDAASDVAFTELAAGYSRRALQAPSGEASASSLDAGLASGLVRPLHPANDTGELGSSDGSSGSGGLPFGSSFGVPEMPGSHGNWDAVSPEEGEGGADHVAVTAKEGMGAPNAVSASTAAGMGSALPVYELGTGLHEAGAQDLQHGVSSMRGEQEYSPIAAEHWPADEPAGAPRFPEAWQASPTRRRSWRMGDSAGGLGSSGGHPTTAGSCRRSDSAVAGVGGAVGPLAAEAVVESGALRWDEPMDESTTGLGSMLSRALTSAASAASRRYYDAAGGPDTLRDSSPPYGDPTSGAEALGDVGRLSGSFAQLPSPHSRQRIRRAWQLSSADQPLSGRGIGGQRAIRPFDDLTVGHSPRLSGLGPEQQQRQHSWPASSPSEPPLPAHGRQPPADAGSPVPAGGQQRQRRRWGSPLQDRAPADVHYMPSVTVPARSSLDHTSSVNGGYTAEQWGGGFNGEVARPSPRVAGSIQSGRAEQGMGALYVSADSALHTAARSAAGRSGSATRASAGDYGEHLLEPEVPPPPPAQSPPSARGPLSSAEECPAAEASCGVLDEQAGYMGGEGSLHGPPSQPQGQPRRSAWGRPLRLMPPPPPPSHAPHAQGVPGPEGCLRLGSQPGVVQQPQSSPPPPPLQRRTGDPSAVSPSPANDEVLCGSPLGQAALPSAVSLSEGLAADDQGLRQLSAERSHPNQATFGPSCPARPDATALPTGLPPSNMSGPRYDDGHSAVAGLPATDSVGSGLAAPVSAGSSSGIVANRGGVAFSIDLQPAPSGSPGASAPRPATAHHLQASTAHLSAASMPRDPVPLALGGQAGLLDWEPLNRQLRDAGFTGLVMMAPDPTTSQGHGHAVPEAASLNRCLSSVLDQYVRRNRLVSELLAATGQSGRVAEEHEAAIRNMQREVNSARAAAERAQRELAELSSQQLPKVEARHASQLARLRSEVAKLKETLRAAELDSASKIEEIRALKATISGLQSASSHSSDVEATALRQKVAQLEGLLRTRDKELGKLKATKEAVVGQAEDGQANALDRAYEAEGAARRLDMELAAAKTRIGQLEQALRQRERDVSTMREDLQQIKACEAAATLVAQERAAAAAEAARRSEGEAAALQGKVKDLETLVRMARQEMEKQRSEAEALRSSAYEEIYRLEDDCRSLGADLASARRSATQLEHVVRAKDREIAKVKDEKEAAKAAERERARVAEEVSVRLESELTATKVRMTQVEGALRTRERELARVVELLRQTQGAEAEAWLKQARTEEGSRKLENDFTSLRLRVLQLEAALKGRDKECDKLGRMVEGLRSETHELSSKLVKAEEAGRKSEAELAAARGKVLNLEGHIRVKEREQERLVRVLAGLKAADSEVAARQSALEDAARRLEAQLLAAKSRVSALEGVVRARDAAVERLNRQLEALKTAEFERTAQTAKIEEASRQQDAEAGSLRQRILQLEYQLRGKDRELERGARQMDAARAAEADAARRLADAQAAISRLEAEVAAGRTRAVQLGDALRVKERELAAATRALEAQRCAEHEANAVAGRTEEVARRLDGEAGELRQRLIQTEGQLRTREREAERQARALEAAQTASAEAAMRQADAEAGVRRLEAEVAGLKQRVAQAESAVRAREKELERLEKQAEQAKGAEAQAEARQRTAEAAALHVDGELSALRARIAQLESAAKGHAKEVERLTRMHDQTKAAEADASLRAKRSEEAARQVAGELSSARNRLTKVEASLAAREQETQRLQRLLAAAEAQAATQVSRSDDFVRRVEGDLGAMRQRATQLAQLIRNKDRQITTLREALEGAKSAEARASEQRRQCEEVLRKMEADLTAERQRAVQLDGQVKSRDRELERLGRQLDAGRDQTSSAAVAAGREVTAIKEAAVRSEAALATAKARITQLEAELVSKERQLEGVQRLAGYSRAGDAEAAVAAEERANRTEEAAKKLDGELAAVRMRYAQLEHAFRSREATLEKLRAALTEKVAREERRLARDKAAYNRIRAAYVATMGAPSAAGRGGAETPGGAAQQQQRAAGAMAAAARELRPVEIVGLYETQREAAAEELAACRAEIRSLADQLRDAQNLIALKDRSGAWRTPQELSDMQARIIMLERRCADQQRELERARSDAAEAMRAAERRLAEVERRATHLKEDNEALVQELDGRPTIQENRALKRELEILEKRLLQVKGSAASSGAGADAEGGETALRLAMASKGRNGGVMLTTAQRMARDRSLHRLGLRALEDWPKDVLIDLVQDVCIELDLSDATTMPAAVRKTLRVVGAVPRMESFIGAVCEAVYRRGAAFLPPHIDGTTDPSKVLDVLSAWIGLLQEGAQMRGAMRSITEALSSRAEGMAMPIHGPGDVLASVRQLVEAEAVALTARESLAAAANHLEAQPEQLLSRVVTHFMRLFDCPSLEGFVPAVNRLYMTLNEQRNFARALAAALGLGKDAGPSACMAKIRELVNAAESGGQAADRDQQGHKLRHDYLKNPAGEQAAATGSAHDVAGASAVTVGVETSAALGRLMALFHVQTAGAVADAAEKHVARLRRLDELLPRYQRLASQLFETLRCTSLEEVMPALMAALHRQ